LAERVTSAVLASTPRPQSDGEYKSSDSIEEQSKMFSFSGVGDSPPLSLMKRPAMAVCLIGLH